MFQFFVEQNRALTKLFEITILRELLFIDGEKCQRFFLIKS